MILCKKEKLETINGAASNCQESRVGKEG